MNREILFKAKEKDSGEWITGYYVKYRTCASRPEYVHGIVPTYASDLYMIKIDPDTLCQYTGLTDKNDNEIWENSILKLPDEDGHFKCEWQEDTARFVLNGDRLTVDFDNYWSYQVEVVGNAFDNPELLEVE